MRNRLFCVAAAGELRATQRENHMELFSYINWFAAMVAAMMVTALCASWVSVKAIQGQRRIEATMREHFALLDRDFGALCTSTSRAGDQIVSIEQRSRDLAARQECLDTTGPMSLHYRQAQALLARGASPDDLVSSCGMARGEAELVAFLHDADGNKSSAKSIN